MIGYILVKPASYTKFLYAWNLSGVLFAKYFTGMEIIWHGTNEMGKKKGPGVLTTRPHSLLLVRVLKI
ncbi:hypothetical protein SAMN05443550_114125 [Pedobacter hartonius]|uniref:Uncharacterized protein n=1 Tax=Pedobacter hartonius TaxID=425514 RepID=A0A1H4HBS7_9SPHI|nr:hypothetical protein SAMN05443550_114125 [Pedobacter hartonius]